MTALDQDREFLLRSLEDLEREWLAGDLDEADYRALKDDYTARAAAVLRAIERQAAGGPSVPAEPPAEAAAVAEPPAEAAAAAAPPAEAAAAAAPPAAPPAAVPAEAPGPRRRWRPVVAALGVVAFAGTAGALVARSAGERVPGEPASGAIAVTGPSAAIAEDLARARELVGSNGTLDAVKLYDAVLERDPRQPEALAYRGWILRLAGRAGDNPALVDKGLEYIERAVAADPGYPDARFFRGVVLFQDRHDPAAAIPDFQAFLASDPPRPLVPMVEDLLRRATAEAEARAPAG